MNRFCIAALLLASFVPTVFSADPSAPEERAHIVNLAKSLEANPVDPNLLKERAWAVKLLTDSPDIKVVLSTCAIEFIMKKKHYKYGPDLTALDLIEGGRFDIEHPHHTDTEQSIAMVAGALKGYDSLVKSDVKASFKEADEMVAKRDAGQLAAFLTANCEKK